MLIQNNVKYLNTKDIALLYDSWEILAPNLYEVSIFFFNGLYDANQKEIPSARVDINKFSMKALNTFGYVISNLDNLNEARSNLYPMMVSLSDFGKLKPFTASILKKSLINAIKKDLGNKWERECGMAWLKLSVYIEKEVMVEKNKEKTLKYFF